MSSSGSSRSPKRYAVAFFGGMSSKGDKGHFDMEINEARQEQIGNTLKKDDLMIDASIPAALYKKHLYPQSEYDTFIHSWSPDFEKILLKLYQPRAWSFEREHEYQSEIDRTAAKVHANSDIKDMLRLLSKWQRMPSSCTGQVAMALSISKVLDFVRHFEDASGHRYSGILLARPDVLLNEPLHLDFGFSNNTGTQEETNATNVIWHTKGYNRQGDYHYRMSSRNARIFQRVYADFPLLSKCKAHTGWVDDFCALHDLRLKGDNGGYWDWSEVVYRRASPDFWQRVAASLNDTTLNLPSISTSSKPHGRVHK